MHTSGEHQGRGKMQHRVHEAGTCVIIKEPLRGKRSFGAVTGTAWVKALPGRVARPLKTIVRTLTVIGGV